MNYLPIKRSELVKSLATQLGFDHCGISKAGFLQEEAPRVEHWLKKNYQGKMSYLENHFDKRLDPRLLVPGARSVISFVYNYYPSQTLADRNGYKIARYAYGEDYHFVIKDKLKELVRSLKHEVGDFEGRVFVDSAPIMERQWAQKSGLGWIGKNSLLLNKQMGSYFFLAELISDLELEPDGPIKDYCGTCTRCIDACPTDAIISSGVVDGSRCISYLTIELKDAVPYSFKEKMENWIFGCDICQEVCPWNRFSQPHHEPAFLPNEHLKNMNGQDWEEMTDEVFKKVFKKSAIKRTKFEGLKRNIAFVKKHNDDGSKNES